MTSKRLTADVRNAIANALCNRAGELVEASLLADEHATAMLAYREIVSEADERRWRRADPEGRWLHYVTALSARVSGRYGDPLDLPKALPVPVEYSGGRGGKPITFRLRTTEERVAAYLSLRSERRGRLNGDKSAIFAAVNRFRTTDDFRKGWPDAVAHKPVDALLRAFEQKAAPVPVDLSRINAAAGLPPRDQKKAA